MSECQELSCSRSADVQIDGWLWCETHVVCDGCWHFGECDRPGACRCTCDGGRAWAHTDARTA